MKGKVGIWVNDEFSKKIIEVIGSDFNKEEFLNLLSEISLITEFIANEPEVADKWDIRMKKLSSLSRVISFESSSFYKRECPRSGTPEAANC